MHRRALLFGGLLAIASGPVVAPHAQTPGDSVGLELLEPIYAISARANGLVVSVAGGATTKSDLACYVRHPGQQTTIAFGRRQAQRRAALGGQAELTFSYAELGVKPDAPLTVLNPLIAEPAGLVTPRRPLRRRRGAVRRPRKA